MLAMVAYGALAVAGAGQAAAQTAAQAIAAQQAQDPGEAAAVRYDVAFPNAVHHEAQVTATFVRVPAGPLRVQMARSSPGRYAIHEFAKNVYAVSAKDGRGRPLAVTRTDPYGWSVAGHDGTVVVSYTLFGDWGDGTYAQIDATHAHLNMPASFLWAVGYDAQPIRVRFRPFDPSWKIATQLPAAKGVNSFWAPNLQYFMDSPTELSDFGYREWPVTDATGKSYVVRLAVHHAGTEADLDAYTAKVRRVIAQHYALFGRAPRYDYGTYTFIADYLPQITGDGMEHRNSTIITDKRGLAAAKFAQINTLSHEFVHSWNVERLRPAELEPFDFTRANPTPSLWFAEGFTQYYGPLLIRRAGESSVDDFLKGLGGTLNGVVNSPARRYGGPEEMSLRAPFVDAAKAIDQVNPNIFVSYYPYGAVLALALDLQLRQRYPGLSLDAYMRALWASHGDIERAYTPADLEAALATLTRDAAFAKAFFDGSVHASGLPDFAPLLAQAGLTLRPVDATRGWLGLSYQAGDGGVVVGDAPVPGSPAYAGGLEKGDAILSLDGKAVGDAEAAKAALDGHRPGDRIAVRYRQRGIERDASLRFAADPAFEVVRGETAGVAVTLAQLAFRRAWLGAD
ncbi:PDZ domain-containing protein [Sphingomonas sp. RP10(2022)]|uniref:PDZ domain-containing protein n=1 Tax=Sphingomonas liriopis TaxID=2949094 RepID=A0A9X2HY58_9SPHN|nr:PDZ domain-containing protein [Sphingomonas liriopis]MCP3736461.1 PDZ domain-containing protein [Sphingomonas liriopis]